MKSEQELARDREELEKTKEAFNAAEKAFDRLLNPIQTIVENIKGKLRT